MLLTNISNLDKRYAPAFALNTVDPLGPEKYTLENPQWVVCDGPTERAWIAELNVGYYLIQNLLLYARNILKDPNFPNGTTIGVPDWIKEDGILTINKIWKTNQFVLPKLTNKDCHEKASIANYFRLYAGEIAKFLESKGIKVPVFVEQHKKGDAIGIFGTIWAGHGGENNTSAVTEYNKCINYSKDVWECTSEDTNRWLENNNELRQTILNILVKLNTNDYGDFKNWPEISKIGLNQIATSDKLRAESKSLTLWESQVNYLIIDQILLKTGAQNLLKGLKNYPEDKFINDYKNEVGWDLLYNPNVDPKVKNLVISDARTSEALTNFYKMFSNSISDITGLKAITELLLGSSEPPKSNNNSPSNSILPLILGLGMFGTAIYIFSKK